MVLFHDVRQVLVLFHDVRQVLVLLHELGRYCSMMLGRYWCCAMS
jgi:hypothetical protein